MSFINRRRYQEVELELPRRMEAFLTLGVNGRRYRIRNVITDAALSGLQTQSIDFYIQMLVLIRKINAGWAPDAADTEASYCDGRFSLHCGAEGCHTCDPIDKQNSWLETWTSQRTQVDTYAVDPGGGWVEHTRHFLFGKVGDSPLWSLAACGTPQRYGNAVASGGSNEDGSALCGTTPGTGNGCNKNINGILIARTASLQSEGYNATCCYTPEKFHQLTYLWSAAKLVDELGNPFFIDFNVTEQLDLAYTIRTYYPAMAEVTAGDGHVIRTYPLENPSLYVTPSASEFANWGFPGTPVSPTAQESNVAPVSLVDPMGSPGYETSPDSWAAVGTGAYYREYTAMWNPVKVWPTGIGRVLHGRLGNTHCWASVFPVKYLKTDKDKFYFNVRYTWARV